MSPKNYASALFASISEAFGRERKKRLQNFLKLIEHNGHAYLLPKITKLLEELYRRQEEKRVIEIVSSAPLSLAMQKTTATKSFPNVREPLYVNTVDETLIGGVQIRMYDRRVDGSYKSELLRLYKNMSAQT